MHYIEENIVKFLGNKVKIQEELVVHAKEFSERMGSSILSKFQEQELQSFYPRMSNIGIPLRQLCLQRDYGRPVELPSISQPNFTISGFYGTMLESFVLFLLRSSGCNVEAENLKVELKIDNYILPGELDLIIDDSVWDVKSASDYSYSNKFVTYKTLEEDDSFGYLGQLFGYAMAVDKPAGGWIVINKAKGLIKVVPIPASIQKEYKDKYRNEFKYKLDYLASNKPAPDCTGVINESFRKKFTGNMILDRNCEWCQFKDKCHPTIVKLESLVSEAKDKPIKYYVKINEKYAK